MIAPRIDSRLDWVNARLQTTRGEVRTRWERRGDEIVLSETLPPGATGAARLGGREVPLDGGASVLRVLAARV